MTANTMTVNHEFEAAREVVLTEIAWFKTLDKETIERIAEAAPRDTPEYEYATAELRRRAVVRLARTPAGRLGERR
jgi:hypothetical protein